MLIWLYFEQLDTEMNQCKRFTYCNGTQNSSAFTFSLCFFCFSDKLYKEIRDMNYEVVVQVVQFHSLLFSIFNIQSASKLISSNMYYLLFFQCYWFGLIIAGSAPKGNFNPTRLCRSKIYCKDYNRTLCFYWFPLGK